MEEPFDPVEAIGNIVHVATMFRTDAYGNADAFIHAGGLVEGCWNLRHWADEGGSVPGGIMPWDGGNHVEVRRLTAIGMDAMDEGDELKVFACAVRLAELVTMENTDHLA